jgi:hypothetical protein
MENGMAGAATADVAGSTATMPRFEDDRIKPPGAAEAARGERRERDNERGGRSALRGDAQQ